MLPYLQFFFSSRRRHTRSLCDWSSDVCSSDLRKAKEPGWVGRAGQDNRANLVRDCAEAMPGREVAWLLGRKLVRSFFNACRDLGRHGLDYLARCVRQIEFASLPLSLPWLVNSLFSITTSQHKVYA